MYLLALSGGDPPFWLYILINVLTIGIAVTGYIVSQRRTRRQREEEVQKQQEEKQHAQRELDRREDILWGYVDAQGNRHKGVVDTVAELQQLLRDFIREYTAAKQEGP